MLPSGFRAQFCEVQGALEYQFIAPFRLGLLVNMHSCHIYGEAIFVFVVLVLVIYKLKILCVCFNVINPDSKIRYIRHLTIG